MENNDFLKRVNFWFKNHFVKCVFCGYFSDTEDVIPKLQYMGKNVLYVGAGTDVRPLKWLEQQCDVGNGLHCVFVDSQPSSEFGTHEYIEKGVNLLSRPNFLLNLDNEMKSCGFIHSNSDSIPREYSGDNGRTVHYYINTSLPERVKQLPPDKFNILISAGHDTDSNVVDVCCKKDNLTFVGFSGTVYNYTSEDIENKHSVVARMSSDVSFRDRFVRFLYVTDSHTVITSTWDQFLLTSKIN